MSLPFEDLAERTLNKGEHLGFEWEVVHNFSQNRCGYVKVLEGHPWYEVPYADIDAKVHGGLTFSKHGKACPTHGEKSEWWVGFDCGHLYMDAPDPSLPAERYQDSLGSLARALCDAFDGRGWGDAPVIRTQEYTENECRKLAEQAAAALTAQPLP